MVASGVEFSDTKPYTPGDSLRHLDWRVLARSEQLVVRRHRAEQELSTVVLLDASADMGTGAAGGVAGIDGGPASKWAYAVGITATLIHWLVHRREPVGLGIIAGREVPTRWAPPRLGGVHAARLYGTLVQTRPAGRAHLFSALADFEERIPRRAMVVVVSDLMEEPAEWAPALSALVSRRGDLRVLHLHDPAEWRLEYDDALRLRSPEIGRPVAIDPLDAREAFEEVVRDYLVEVREALGAWRGRHVLTPTDRPMAATLAELLRGM